MLLPAAAANPAELWGALSMALLPAFRLWLVLLFLLPLAAALAVLFLRVLAPLLLPFLRVPPVAMLALVVWYGM
jgi:hypothetical protein